MNVHEIFSIPLFNKNLSLDNNPIRFYSYSQREQNPYGNRVSNIGGWQSNPFFEVPNELKELFDSVDAFSSEISEVLGIEKPSFSNCWININGYKDFNKSHLHADSVLSGVYYVKTPENCGNLIFEHPSIDWMELSLSPDQIKIFSKFNSIGWQQKAESGVLCIFPGWVKHYVNPNQNEAEDRISISFNLSYH